MFYKVVGRLIPYDYYRDDFPEVFPNDFIIDIETTGLDPNEDIIVCLGIADLWHLSITIYFLEDPSKWQEFHKFCRKKVFELLNSGDVWAYNSLFESKFLKIPRFSTTFSSTRGIQYGIFDLMCGTGFYRLKQAAMLINYKYKLNVDELIKDVDIDGKDVPKVYLKDWCVKRDEKAKWRIIDHNHRDLIRGYLVRYHVKKVALKIRDQLPKFAPEPHILSLIHI